MFGLMILIIYRDFPSQNQDGIYNDQDDDADVRKKGKEIHKHFIN